MDFNRRGVLGCKDWIERYSLGAKLEGHRGCVNSVLWSEDGSEGKLVRTLSCLFALAPVGPAAIEAHQVLL